MPRFNSGGDNLHFRIQGEGPLALFLHNGFYSSASWDAVLPEFANTLCSVTWDRRGYGKSGRAAAGPTDIDAGAGELDDLLDHLETRGIDTERLVLVGHCMGGAIAARWAARNPGRCAALVLEATGFFSDELMRRKLEIIIRPWERLPKPLRNAMKRMHGPWRAPLLWDHIATWDADYLMHPGYDLRPDLERITCPTLVATGTRDIYFKPEHTSAGHARLRNAKLWQPEGAGHDLHEELPAEFIDRVRGFLVDAGVPAL